MIQTLDYLPVAYQEQQRLRLRWLWAFLLSVPAICLVALIAVHTVPIDPTTAARLTGVFAILLVTPGCLLIGIFWSIRLFVQVDVSGITLRWMTGRRQIPMAQIVEWNRLTVAPQLKLGKYRPLQRTRSYLIGSRDALSVKLRNGTLVVIGTANLAAMENALADCWQQARR